MTKITGERVHLSITDKVTYEHVHRYLFAAKFIENKIVLDIACGTGYGSYYMSLFAKSVYGLDINEDVINENKAKYNKTNLKFICSNATNTPFEDNFADVIVSFETIEHIQNDIAVLAEFKRILKKDGLLIISTPNKSVSEKSQLVNPYHVKEYYFEEFEKLLSSFFPFKLFLFQASFFASIIIPKQTRNISNIHIYSTDDEQLKEGFIHLSDDEDWNKQYFIAIASEQPLDNLSTTSILNANEHTKGLMDLLEKVYNSTNYRLGFYLTFPFKLILHLFGIRKYPDIV